MAKSKAPKRRVSQAPKRDPKPTGRPPGSKTQKLVVDCTPGRCKKCSSTEREGYSDVKEMPYRGERNGLPYTHIVWRRTRCKSCGQGRIDQCLENRI